MVRHMSVYIDFGTVVKNVLPASLSAASCVNAIAKM